jgi:Holliday junction resolvase-like predicted endonuclease
MQNTGEEIVGAYLQHIRGCEFVQYNLHTPDVQGEVDVIGINIRDRIIYVCEVAIHLITGLQYVKGGRPGNVNRFLKKFEKDIE